jgi:hypothetical protein
MVSLIRVGKNLIYFFIQMRLLEIKKSEWSIILSMLLKFSSSILINNEDQPWRRGAAKFANFSAIFANF